MDKIKKNELAVDVIKSLAHPTRLYIVEKLAEGECCVCEFHEGIGGDFSMVSKHLSVLKKAGVIVSDKRGLKVFYKLKMSCVVSFIGCIKNLVQKNAEEALMEL